VFGQPSRTRIYIRIHIRMCVSGSDTDVDLDALLGRESSKE